MEKGQRLERVLGSLGNLSSIVWSKNHYTNPTAYFERTEIRGENGAWNLSRNKKVIHEQTKSWGPVLLWVWTERGGIWNRKPHLAEEMKYV
jgi:hypothetical protein